MHQDDLLGEVLSLCRATGVTVLDIYSDESAKIEMKSDQSPLTLADKAAHEQLSRGLTRLDSTIPVVSEEDATMHPHEARASMPRFWLIDPLDGTKEFIKRSGEFTINVALIEGDRAVLGVVYAPVVGQMFAATLGGGAFSVLPDGERRLLKPIASASDPVKVAVSRDHRTPDDERLLAAIPGAIALPMGSSLKFCKVASGEVDFYARFGGSMEWDTAAAQCIVEAAGARVTNAAGEPLRYNKSSLRNPPLFCYADPQLLRYANL